MNKPTNQRNRWWLRSPFDLALRGGRARTVAPGVWFILWASVWAIFGCAGSGALAQTSVGTGNSIAQAQPLVLPFNSTSGLISAYDGIDYYKFTARAGQEVTVWLLAKTMDSPLVPTLAYYDATGKLLAYNDSEWNVRDGCYCGDPLLYLKMPTTGVFYLSVTSTAHFRKQSAYQGGATGPYELYLFTTFGVGVGDGNEPNDSRDKATPIVLPYTSLYTNLNYFGDIDWYSFAAQKGKKVSVDIDALEMKSKPGWDLIAKTRIGVFDQRGQLLAMSTAGEDPDTGFTQDPALSFEVPSDGTYYVAVTTATDSQFTTAFTSPEFLADPNVSSRKGSIGFYRIEINFEETLFFPQVANGKFGEISYATSIILINTTSYSAKGRVNFFQPDGTPVTGSLIPSAQEGDTYRFELPAGGSTIIKTDGLGAGLSGYATVSSSVALGGSAVFSQYAADGTLMTEAAVEISAPVEFFTIPVEVVSDFNTGIAIANTRNSISAAHLYVKLIDAQGVVARTRSLTLDPGVQVSLYISGVGQLFPDITTFRGSLQILSDLPLSAVALRSSRQTLTTIRPMALNQTFQPVTLVFPQFIAGSSNGSAYRTKIILANSGYFTVKGNINFKGSDGNPLPISIGSSYAASQAFSIPPLGTLFLDTAAQGSLAVGYVTVQADHGIGGAVIYAQSESSSGRLQAEVAVAPASSYRSFFVFAQCEEGYNTGLALANLDQNSNAVDFVLQPDSDEESVSPATPLTLGAGRQTAQLVAGTNQIFPQFLGKGTLKVSATGPIAAVALRLTAGTMTSLPLIPVP
jgi:hypothetical protein